MNKIMKLSEYEDAIYYRAACACTDPQCDLSLELEIDKEFDMIFLNMYEDLYYASYWKSDNWFIDKWYRIKGAVKLLFTGRIKVENSFIFQGEDQINDFLSALKQGMEQLKINKKNKEISLKAVPTDKTTLRKEINE
jgi:hypothetical protein